MARSDRVLSSIRKVGFIYALNKASQFAFLAVSSRILTPAEFGIVAATQIVIAFADMLANAGVGMTLIQRRELSALDVRVAVTISVAAGLLTYAASALLADDFARFLGIPELTVVIPVMCIVIVLNSLVGISSALLQRADRAVAFSAAQGICDAAGLWLVALPAMLLGASYWSLVAGQVAAAFGTLISTGRLAGHSLVPFWDRAIARGLLGKSAGFFASRFLNYASTQVDYIFVGRVFDASALGLYSRAYRLMDYMTNAYIHTVNRVVFPAMSRLQDDGEQLRRALLRGVTLSSLVTAPVAVFLTLAAEDVVITLLGAQWFATAAILAVLGPFAYFRVNCVVFSTYFRARGDIGVLLLHETLNVIVLVVGLFLAVPLGLTGMALAVGVAAAAHWLLLGMRVARRIRLSASELARCYVPAALISTLVGVSVGVAQRYTASDVHAVRLAIDCIAASLSAGGFLLLAPRVLLSSEGILLRNSLLGAVGALLSPGRGRAPKPQSS